MSEQISKAIRPITCALAMLKGSIPSVFSEHLIGNGQRLTRRLLREWGQVRAQRDKLHTGTRSSTLQPQSTTQVDAELVDHPRIGAMRRDAVDEASWESFPASDPPGY